jgi:hypothetical protein
MGAARCGAKLIAFSAALGVAVAVVVSWWGEGGGDHDGGPGRNLSGGLDRQNRPGLLVAVVLPDHADVQALLPQLPADCKERLPGQGGRADLDRAW